MTPTSTAIKTALKVAFYDFFDGPPAPLNGQLMETSQELRMLSSVTLNCQVTKIVMDSASQL